MQDLKICRALGCHKRRVRPGASHCKEHTIDWRAIEADQRALKERGTPVTAAEWDDLRARRLAMSMYWPPRNLANETMSRSGATSVIFGDAATDKRPPSSLALASATYRSGAGDAGSDRRSGEVMRGLLEAISHEMKIIEEQLNRLYEASFVDTATGSALDSLNEMGEMESLRLQMATDRLSKLMSMLSNLLTKAPEPASGITQHIK